MPALHTVDVEQVSLRALDVLRCMGLAQNQRAVGECRESKVGLLVEFDSELALNGINKPSSSAMKLVIVFQGD
ncbi:hypothetical protein V6N11_053145 [Hibiscus sabdariffa]|uniref:Uncharacterized protein n=1 Tax=Hibiscus sabdariffa TaxID=183260 RepID=A0ABR2UC63_9ROSI